MAESLIMRARVGDEWLWPRYLIRGTRLEPSIIAWHHQTMTTEEIMDAWELSREQVEAAVRFTANRRAGGRKAWAQRHPEAGD